MNSKEKLARMILAAAEVSEAMCYGTKTEGTDADTPPVPAGLAESLAALATDLPVVRRILTPTYTVRPSKEQGAIHCTSRTGIDDANDTAWGSVMAALRQHFGPRLLEVAHNVCYRHTDFTIYTRATLPTPTATPAAGEEAATPIPTGPEGR